MIAGYDYLTVRWRMRRFWTRARVAGAALLITGGLVVGIGAAYYGYAGNARAGLAHYQVQTVEIAPVATAPTRQPQATPAQPAAVRPLPEISLYSGDAGRIPSGPSLPPGFEAIELSQEATRPPAAPATSMRIPRLGIDSPVVELPIVDLGDRRAYQTPDNTIGHIPETANAGETGQGWYFGHTESPVLDQGSVFFNLQQIPDLLRKGQNIEIITDNGTQQFLYRITATRVVHEDDLILDSGDGHQIHLVSCIPRLVYDHRLIVDAQLIAQKSGS